MTCPTCGGSGKAPGEPQPDTFGVYTPCDACGGSGSVDCDRLHCNDTIGPCDACPQRSNKRWTIYVCPEGHVSDEKRLEGRCNHCFRRGGDEVEVCPVTELTGRGEAAADLLQREIDLRVELEAELERARKSNLDWRNRAIGAESKLGQLKHLLACPGGLSPTDVQVEGLRIIGS